MRMSQSWMVFALATLWMLVIPAVAQDSAVEFDIRVVDARTGKAVPDAEYVVYSRRDWLRRHPELSRDGFDRTIWDLGRSLGEGGQTDDTGLASVTTSRPREGHSSGVLHVRKGNLRGTAILTSKNAGKTLEVRVEPHVELTIKATVTAPDGKPMCGVRVSLFENVPLGAGRRWAHRGAMGLTGPKGEAAKLKWAHKVSAPVKGREFRLVASIVARTDVAIELAGSALVGDVHHLAAPHCGAVQLRFTEPGGAITSLAGAVRLAGLPKDRLEDDTEIPEPMPQSVLLGIEPQATARLVDGRARFDHVEKGCVLAGSTVFGEGQPRSIWNFFGVTTSPESNEAVVEMGPLPPAIVLCLESKADMTPLAHRTVSFSVEDSGGWTSTTHGKQTTDEAGRLRILVLAKTVPTPKRVLVITYEGDGDGDAFVVSVPVRALENGDNDHGVFLIGAK